MKIVYEFVRDGIEGDVKVEVDKNTGVTRVTVEPFFYSPTAYAPIVRTTSSSGSKELHNELQVAAGKSGRIKHIVPKRVTPQCEETPAS